MDTLISSMVKIYRCVWESGRFVGDIFQCACFLGNGSVVNVLVSVLLLYQVAPRRRARRANITTRLTTQWLLQASGTYAHIRLPVGPLH